MGSLNLFSRDCIPLDLLKTSLNTNTFVETGCYYGDSLLYAVTVGFTRCYSCDIDQTMVDFCKSRLKDSPAEIEISQESSIEFLTNLMPKIKDVKSVVFFLDAHLPEFDKNQGQIKINKDEFTFPLEQELDIIYQHRKDHQDVIICDDLRIYEDLPFQNGVWHDRHQFNLNSDFLNKYVGYTVKKFTEQEGYILLAKE